MTGHEIFDRRLVRQYRQRAADQFHDHAFLFDRTADDILERLAVVRRTFATALILGVDDGRLVRALAQRHGVETVVAADSAPFTLAGKSVDGKQGAKVWIDEEALPFADASIDLVIAPLTLHCVNDLPGVMTQLRRCMKPDGLLLASLLGGDTLTELRQSFLAAESDTLAGAGPRVGPFADVRTLGSLLQRTGYALPVVDGDRFVATYPSPLALMHELRSMGAGNALAARSRRPLKRSTLARMTEIYRARFGTFDGRVPATFEIVTMTGWAPDASQPKPLAPGSATMRLADALKSFGASPRADRDEV